MTYEPARTTQYTPRPGVIDFAVGQPEPALLPVTLLRQAADHRLAAGGGACLAYGVEQGDDYFRVALADLLRERGCGEVAADRLMVTPGISGTLDLICTLFARPGDTVLVEEPTYFLSLRIFADHGLHVVSVPTDEQGLIVEALEAQLSAGRPAFLYTIPTFHNPAGVTLPDARRQRLIRLAEAYELTVVADEVYQLLGYDEPPPPPLAGYSADADVLSLGSFSKILAPGLRLGWLHAQPRLIERITRSGLLLSGGGLNPFAAGIVRSALELDLLPPYIDRLREVYGRRMRALAQAIRERLAADVDFLEPKGGYFIWLALPGAGDTRSLLERARRNGAGVLFQPGSRFSSTGGLNDHLRLCFAMHEEDELREGVARLARVIRQAH